MLASLVGFLGDFDRAEEAAQEAFTIAAERWPASGVPAKPGAWLVTTARNRAIDRIRRERSLAEKIHLLPMPEATMDYCTDMHTKDAAHAGESQVRLNLVAVWREATVFTEAERAALALTEQGTRIADAPEGVTDEVWTNAAQHYDEDQLGALVALIAVINTYNRLNVIVRQPAGDYRPGQWG